MGLKKGDEVMVFQKWITREDEEAVAVLRQRVNCPSNPPRAETWELHFWGDGEGKNYCRTVWEEDKR